MERVLVGTHVCCLLRDRRRAALFLFPRWTEKTCEMAKGHQGTIPGSHIRYASQVLPIRFLYLIPGIYPTFPYHNSSTITLAHPDEPYMQKYDKFVETPIPRAKT